MKKVLATGLFACIIYGNLFSQGNQFAQAPPNKPPYKPPNTAIISAEHNMSVKIYPNPSTEYLIIDIDKESYSKISINLLDLNGRILKVLEKDQMNPVLKSFALNIDNITNGLYLVKVIIDNESITRKIVVGSSRFNNF
jgi:hypothetical protein